MFTDLFFHCPRSQLLLIDCVHQLLPRLHRRWEPGHGVWLPGFKAWQSLTSKSACPCLGAMETGASLPGGWKEDVQGSVLLMYMQRSLWPHADGSLSVKWGTVLTWAGYMQPGTWQQHPVKRSELSYRQTLWLAQQKCTTRVIFNQLCVMSPCARDASGQYEESALTGPVSMPGPHP